jgi:hypothetical protein
MDPTKPNVPAIASYLIKTDKAGITPIVMP